MATTNTTEWVFELLHKCAQNNNTRKHNETPESDPPQKIDTTCSQCPGILGKLCGLGFQS
eukprot:7339489-Ditylum_brightwellii.AAC.1